jgi:hypothetical protein
LEAVNSVSDIAVILSCYILIKAINYVKTVKLQYLLNF